MNQWNTLYRPGQAVKVRRDDGSILETVTQSEAWLLGGRTAVVALKGISGGFRLDRVTGC